MEWAPRNLRGKTVWAKTTTEGRLAIESDGRVEVKYDLREGSKVYRAGARNLEAGDGSPSPDASSITPSARGASKGTALKSRTDAIRDSAARTSKANQANKPARALPANAIIVYTDGACTGNPGPMGLGAVVIDGAKRRELSVYLGHGTNNIAELTAIESALDLLRNDDDWDPDRTVVVHTDSSYAIGVLSKGWKAKANQDLIARMREKVATFVDLRFVYVPGHAGVEENERCDELARDAVARRR